MKCDDEECCAPLRSSLKTVLPSGFLPPPLCVSNSADLAVKSLDGEGSTFLSLFQHLTINQESSGYSGINKFQISYDVCCPTARDYTVNCSICKLYFPSIAMVGQHKKEMHPKVKVNEVPRTRPVRIAARRQRQEN